MDIVHEINGLTTSGTAKNAALMLTNGRGGYVLLRDYPASRFDGVFFYANGNMYKVIEALEFAEEPVALRHSGSAASFKRNGGGETYFLPKTRDGLLVRLPAQQACTLILDARRSYDDRQYGRSYTFSEQEECLVIKYTKRNDAKDASADRSEYNVFLAVYGTDVEYKTVKEWMRREYDLDAKRKSPPDVRWVYSACGIKGTDISFGFGLSKEAAIDNAKHLAQNSDALVADKRQDLEYLEPLQSLPHSSLAYAHAINSLNGLSTNNDIFAGFPWFFQHWTRDTLISLGAHIELGNFEFAKTVIMKKIQELVSDDYCLGRMRSHPTSTLCTSDGAGWLFVRIGHYLKKTRETAHAFSADERTQIVHALEHYFNKLHPLIKDGLVQSEKDQTWMDTSYKTDVREGFCVEIQALTLAAAHVFQAFTGRPAPGYAELKQGARKFWNGAFLVDRISDPIARPNAFIAAYVCPQLLSDEEWEACIDTLLPKLWLHWGGLASIDTGHPLFLNEHTGVGNESYHRGDSWYWINNLAAIVMHRLNSHKYHRYIHLLLHASSREILFSGAIGHHAEISSAADLRSQGCLSQAWSAAMFIELIHQIERS